MRPIRRITRFYFFILGAAGIFLISRIFRLIVLLIAAMIVIASVVFLKLTFKAIIRLFDFIKYHASDIKRIDTMDGIDFEHYLAVHFRKQGYRVTVTPPEHDYGVDLILRKGKEKIAVQAKRYNFSKSYNVTYRAVQEVAAGMKYYKCNSGMVVTNSSFTEAAINLAKCNNIEMWDRNTLIKKFNICTAPREEECPNF